MNHVEAVMNASLSLAQGNHREWKDHADAMLPRHHGRTLEQVIEDIAPQIEEAARSANMRVEDLAHETLPFYMALLMWGRAGRPHFSLTPDFFQTILLTDFGDPTDEPIYMPFDAFTMSFPLSDAFGIATRLFVYKVPTVLRVGREFQTSWNLCRSTLMIGDDPIFTQWPIGMTRREFLDENSVLDEPSNNPGTKPIEPEQRSLTAKMRQLLANVFSYIEAAGPLPRVVHHSLERAPVERIHPTRPLYDVGRVVKLSKEMREALKSARGGGDSRSLIHRFIVRGHWRNQPHGPNRSLRRRQWVEPFWKGPDNVVEALSKTYEVS